ncbi:2,3,4,5-tetrahydropyridine-2,6-dicarboxylate N-succinyltransferase [Sediminivirga luteola]|uniref:2,3,4,5-tetrahydropyridine-2,6-dicarboxylate N-succinyltransferase n=1 Tax=Sediminivirga luteola TaxID=1774748 RepID=A0A8J2TW72_9MICO|nr:2,3,4,5-tetrahydropyridine-2,6-dicarboxylate N-succinyltransferase [Sediminivirga luteola]MCI2265707.1 2,3,4,5-tetrahydropyridine-2,6-dicarboxylate N-succinyltransferase [Sediminivirga luteola]GGA07298.1 2,3,4,5-tetrahydropyridine-2,6-dicarboxylate N-succinyltransferase [Sediminivirga luteola]
MTENRYLTALGIATEGRSGVLSVWYPSPALVGSPDAGQTLDSPAAGELRPLEGEDSARGTSARLVATTVAIDEAPEGAADAYLRLHALSHRLVRPNEIDLTGLFGQLNNVVWTSAGAVDPQGFETARARLIARDGTLAVYGVDKFPRMTDFVVPSGVRIGDADRVRLGAHLAEGTVVMHEGFVNFNAGTLGPAMVEGRISQGVVVGANSDVGGGASIMGTLSGGGTEKIAIGERSLLGANAGVGISIGDDCIVEAGLYVTAGAKVRVLDGEQERTVKAIELSRVPNLLFRRNSATGAIEALSRTGAAVELNPDLH